jgi:hypothetical protein
MISKKELISTLIKSLKIDDNILNYETINDEIELINQEEYLNFYKEVVKQDSFGNGLKAIIKVSDKYKTETMENLLVGTREQAKAMYDKFYSYSCAMLDYTQKNRNKWSSDRDFFLSVKYDTLKHTDGTNAYTAREIYVLNELGRGEFLLGIRLALSSNDIINSIEAVIKKAVVTKYGNQAKIAGTQNRAVLENLKIRG